MTNANRTPITCEKLRDTRLCCSSIAAAFPDKWQVMRCFAEQYASAAMVRLIASLSPIVAEKDGPPLNSRPSLWNYSKTQPSARLRLWKRNGAQPSVCLSKRFENSWRFFSSELRKASSILNRPCRSFPDKFLRADRFVSVDQISLPPRQRRSGRVAPEDVDLAPLQVKHVKAPRDRAPAPKFR